VKSAFRTSASGNLHVEPIVRFGKIALEETQADVCIDPSNSENENKWKSVRAMLIESISFEGESGSPVFSYLEHIKEVIPGSEEDVFYKKRQWLPRPVRLNDGDVPTPLVGMISSHWKVESKVRKDARTNPLGEVGLNSGIAVVIPSDDIKEFLMHDEEVMKDREKVPKVPVNQRTSPLSVKVQDEEQGITKDEFFVALKKASRKIEPKKQG
jgi:hypothetical protein